MEKITLNNKKDNNPLRNSPSTIHYHSSRAVSHGKVQTGWTRGVCGAVSYIGERAKGRTHATTVTRGQGRGPCSGTGAVDDSEGECGEGKKKGKEPFELGGSRPIFSPVPLPTQAL